jgi:hypothetical protein
MPFLQSTFLIGEKTKKSSISMPAPRMAGLILSKYLQRSSYSVHSANSARDKKNPCPIKSTHMKANHLKNLPGFCIETYIDPTLSPKSSLIRKNSNATEVYDSRRDDSLSSINIF